MAAQLVWFKRDLRVHDHAPLAEAARRGPVLALYVYEPEVIGAEDFDAGHLAFVNQSLEELSAALAARGVKLLTRVGEVREVLAGLHALVPFEALWSHEETGNALTYARDRRVKAWARERGVTWTELPQTGVVRGLRRREGWSSGWERRMRQPIVEAPSHVEAAPTATLRSAGIVGPESLGLRPSVRDLAQPGGEQAAQERLRSFLEVRGAHYRADMSSPVQGWDGCSRLSPHLAWGTISLRTVVQATCARQAELRELRRSGASFDRAWLGSLASFQSRLRWHCHFVQKLESEPAIEHACVNRVFDGLCAELDEARFAALREGRTGFPMIDACVRSLARSGWLNFRMRAMVMSFAAHDLWLPWRPVGLWLARQFVDYEPGIHWSQVQMQAGVTGINAVRVYSPAKQQRDQDPTGEFVRRWVPELAAVPTEHLAEPHRMSLPAQRAAGLRIGSDYPAPMVDHAEASRASARRIYALRRTEAAREEAARVYDAHGSRKRPQRRGGGR